MLYISLKIPGLYYLTSRAHTLSLPHTHTHICRLVYTNTYKHSKCVCISIKYLSYMYYKFI